MTTQLPLDLTRPCRFLLAIELRFLPLNDRLLASGQCRRVGAILPEVPEIPAFRAPERFALNQIVIYAAATMTAAGHGPPRFGVITLSCLMSRAATALTVPARVES